MLKSSPLIAPVDQHTYMHTNLRSVWLSSIALNLYYTTVELSEFKTSIAIDQNSRSLKILNAFRFEVWTDQVACTSVALASRGERWTLPICGLSMFSVVRDLKFCRKTQAVWRGIFGKK